VFVCDVDVVDEEAVPVQHGHDFEVDVGVQPSSDSITASVTLTAAGRAAVTGHLRPAGPISDSKSGPKAEIFLVHYDPLTRTSTVHQTKLPSSLPGFSETEAYLWINDITSLEFDERLGVLYLLLDRMDGGVLFGLEFV